MHAGNELPGNALSVLDQAPCGLMQTDANGLLLRANRTFCRWLGYGAAELLGQRKLQELLTMGGRIFHQTHWLPLMQMQGTVSEVKLEFVHRDGRTIPMVLNAVRYLQDGCVVHELAAYVTHDRDKYEHELLASQKNLEVLVAQANRLEEAAQDRALLAEQMVGIVSHDLRNPLSTIQMGVVLLTRAGAAPLQNSVLQRIARAADRATRLIGDLLDFTQARLGSGIPISTRRVDLHAAVSENLDELAQAFTGRALRHQRMGSGDCLVDTDRLAQLVGNLVANAVAYGSPGTPVTVTSTADQDWFEVAVHNLGPAIAPELQPGLFTPMSRGTDHVHAGRSVGLGLFIVAEIAKAHGGRVSVSSSAQAGTTFSARFPN